MNYLLDKKTKRKKFYYVALGIVALFVLFYFRLGISNSLSFLSHTVFTPIIFFGNDIGGKFGGLGAYFSSKNSLLKENEDLKSQILQNQADMANYASVVTENVSLKETLGRKNSTTTMILSAILSKPNKSPYDTLITDAGREEGIQVGNVVFALGNIPIGRIAEVYSNSSKVILFSSSGEKTQVIVSDKNIFMELVGRGGGNFEMIIPRDLALIKGDQVTLPGITPYVVGIVETIISDPRDPFIKALLVSPVNIQELKFVEVAE